MSGSDFAVHGNDPVEAAVQVRNWLRSEASCGRRAVPCLGEVHRLHGGDLVKLVDAGHSDEDVRRLPIPELLEEMQGWIAAFPVGVAYVDEAQRKHATSYSSPSDPRSPSP